MTKYLWPAEGQTFTQLLADHSAKLRFSAKGKKLGRPVGSKNKDGHKAGRKKIHPYGPYFKVTPDQIDPAFGRAYISARAQERMD